MSLCFNVNLFMLMFRISCFVRHKSSYLNTTAQEMKAFRFYWIGLHNMRPKAHVFHFAISLHNERLFLLYSFFWVISWSLNFMCRRFGTLCLHRQCKHRPWRWNRQCSEMSAHKIQMLGNHPKEKIQHSEHGKSMKSRGLFLLWAWKSFETNHSTIPRL
jgi:hypothetical protein